MMRKNLFLILSLVLSLIISSAGISQGSSASPDISRVGLDKEIIYFVMPDRYKNGDSSNDNFPGFEPGSTAHFHGGDLRGLIGSCQEGDDGLARIKKLGFTTVWLTPLVAQQQPTEGGAGYHGYWGVDFLNVDRHFGTNEELIELRDCAKKLGLKLVLDVVTNHTGDVIRYEDRKPFIPEGLERAKNPNWLNEISNYHNAGDMNRCWGEGSCTEIGDFYGLDDVATEKAEVVRGWADIYSYWISNYGFVGFRVDTARHLDKDFFRRWSPAINSAATDSGIRDFTIFGEVWDQNPISLMPFIRERGMQTALDFPFQNFAIDWASGNSDAAILKNLFDYDDIYTSETSSAYNLVTFLGNHDMGRVAFLIRGRKINPDNQLLNRVKIAHALLYLSRGIPVVYYGDEVGITGTGKGSDQLARQSLFPTVIKDWQSELRVGGKPIKTGDSFKGTNGHPIAKYLVELSDLRARIPAFQNGQMEIRYAKDSTFVFSKRAIGSEREYLVAINNSSKSSMASFDAATMGSWRAILGEGKAKSQKARVSVSLPPLSATVFEPNRSISENQVKVGVLKAREDLLTGYLKISANLISKGLNSVEFLKRDSATGAWQSLGVDLGSPYRIYIDPTTHTGEFEVKAVVTNAKGVNVEFKPIKVSLRAP